MNDLERFRSVFDGIVPYSGTPPKGYYPDWTGTLTHADFRAYQGMKPEKVGGAPVKVRLPRVEDGEGWFEAVNQVAAAREARGRFVMVSLGACYGAQAVGSCLVLRAINPMPCKLVAVEPEPTNLSWVARHFRDNGIDPNEHWLIGTAIGGSNEPTLFPVGAPGSGAQNSIATNHRSSRQIYAAALTASSGRAKAALRSILLDHRTGLKRDLLSGAEIDDEANLLTRAVLGLRNVRTRLQRPVRRGGSDVSALTEDPSYFVADIRLMSTLTLQDVLAPFDRVDYLEADIQQSEIVVFPPFMDVLKRKVRRLHIGTHGERVHHDLAGLLRQDGWEMVFDYPPNAHYETAQGNFSLNDGVLTAVNPTI